MEGKPNCEVVGGESGFGLTARGKALTSEGFLLRSNPTGTELEEDGAVAQLGARLNGIQEVTGSIPVSSTFVYKGLAEFG